MNQSVKDINVSRYISNATHFRDRHLTMILWPQCSLGTSGTEHLSTASSCHTKKTHVQYTHQHNIYTDVMATEKVTACVHRYKGRRMQREKENLEERKANSSVEVAGFTDIVDIHSIMLL